MLNKILKFMLIVMLLPPFAFCALLVIGASSAFVDTFVADYQKAAQEFERQEAHKKGADPGR